MQNTAGGDIMKYDIVIKNGRIIDPSLEMDCNGDIFVSGDKIVKPGEDESKSQIDLTIDAEDCIIIPGLIDFHTHLFYGGSDIGIPPDLGLIPNGVTTAVDAGTAGCDNYEAFHNNIITNSIVRIKSFINVCPVGLTTLRYSECVDPKYFDLNKIRYLFEKYPGEILGLKLRLSRNIVGEMGIRPLTETIKLAEKLECPIVVHMTDPPVETGQVANLLRKGDIFVHMYHGTGNTILDDSLKVKRSIRDARERGVLFDAGEGGLNISFNTAKAGIEDSFLPDIISTDITPRTMYKHPVVSLPNVMSKYLNLGIELSTIIKACTYTPARLINMEDSVGTLKPGAYADIAIFKLADLKSSFYDTEGNELEGTKLLIPMATIKSGRVMYRRIDFR